MNDKILEVSKIVILVMLVTMSFFPITKWIANHVGALDMPNKRKVHKKPMPLMGGLMMFFGFLFGYMVFAPQNTQMLAILIGAIVVIITGMIDDIKPLKAKEKMLGQIIAALIITFYGKILLDDVTVFGLYFEFGWLSYPLTIIFIIALMNCINFIDGLDGLASGISTIFFITIGILAFILHNIGSLEITLAFIMLGACLGFLVFGIAGADAERGSVVVETVENVRFGRFGSFGFFGCGLCGTGVGRRSGIGGSSVAAGNKSRNRHEKRKKKRDKFLFTHGKFLLVYGRFIIAPPETKVNSFSGNHQETAFTFLGRYGLGGTF